MSTREQRTAEILLVEDNPSDVLMLRAALSQCQLPHKLSVVGDGVEAIAYLRRQGRYSEASRPSLILLDLNMPRKDGREVLAEIKADPELRLIPVVVLTTSNADEDIIRSYGLHANSYAIKPLDFGNFTSTVQTICQFWFRVVVLPPQD